MRIGEFNLKDFGKAIGFAIRGMHLDWYMKSPFVLRAYGRYFLYMEMNRATQIIAAYDGDRLAALLLAEIRGEKPVAPSFFRGLYVKMFDGLQRLVAGEAVGDYKTANTRMLSAFQSRTKADGELIFLAADPEMAGKGTGTLLLKELQRREPGKRICLFTDSACTWQFYEHRGFERAEERRVELQLEGNTIPLTCYLYSRVL